MKTWIGIYISNISKVNEGIFWVTLVSAILLWGFLGVINFLTINIFNVIEYHNDSLLAYRFNWSSLWVILISFSCVQG